MYGFYIASNATGKAELTLGGIDNTKIATGSSVEFVASDGQWDVVPTAIFVGGTAVVVPASSGQPPVNQTPFIFDTGVANMFLSTALTEVSLFRLGFGKGLFI